jgi:hypothetical protein
MPEDVFTDLGYSKIPDPAPAPWVVAGLTWQQWLAARGHRCEHDDHERDA